jgi:lysophospholipase L1-like esterase
MRGLVSARTARRIARGALFGGGGIGALGAGTYGLLRLEAMRARRSIGVLDGGPPTSDGVYGSYDGEPLSFIVLGDSAAAGLGVSEPDETPGALLAAGLAELGERAVRLTTLAQSGARTSDLARQVEAALVELPHVALIIVGGNDVTHRVRPAVSVRLLDEAVRALRDAGCGVVVGTCPDLGTIEPIPQPLRWLVRRASRQLAAAQTVAVIEAGARSVSLGPILGPEFRAAPSDMFAIDRFHPSAAGYAAAAAAILPSLASAVGFWPDDEDQPDAARGDGVLPVSVAAAAAAAESGAEVTGTQVGGHDRGPRGRWAQLRHRRRSPLPEPEREEELPPRPEPR